MTTAKTFARYRRHTRARGRNTLRRYIRRRRRGRKSKVATASQRRMTAGSGIRNQIVRQFNFSPRPRTWVAGNVGLQQPVGFATANSAFVDVFSLSQIADSINSLLEPYLELYDSYKLLSVKMTFRPNYRQSTMGDLQGGGAFQSYITSPATPLAPFDSNMSLGITAISGIGANQASKYNFMGFDRIGVACMDYDDQDIVISGAGTNFGLNYALNYNKNTILTPGKTFSMTIIPKLTTVIAIAEATGVTGVVANKKSKASEPWITTENTAPAYLGVKWFFEADDIPHAILSHHYNWRRIMTYKVAFKGLKI